MSYLRPYFKWKGALNQTQNGAPPQCCAPGYISLSANASCLFETSSALLMRPYPFLQDLDTCLARQEVIFPMLRGADGQTGRTQREALIQGAELVPCTNAPELGTGPSGELAKMIYSNTPFATSTVFTHSVLISIRWDGKGEGQQKKEWSDTKHMSTGKMQAHAKSKFLKAEDWWKTGSWRAGAMGCKCHHNLSLPNWKPKHLGSVWQTPVRAVPRSPSSLSSSSLPMLEALEGRAGDAGG